MLSFLRSHSVFVILSVAEESVPQYKIPRQARNDNNAMSGSE